MKLRWAAGTVFVLCLVGCVTGLTPRQHSADADDPLRLMEKVADWQLAHQDDAALYATQGRTNDSRGWVQGAFYVGLTRLAERSKQPRFTRAVVEHGAAQSWRLGDRPLHADDHVIGQSYIWASRHLRDPAALAPMRAGFDRILANPPKVSLDFEIKSPDGGDRPCQARWCWCDALFMSPPTWAALSAAVGDPRYLDYADAEFRATTDYLYDREEHLYYRDSRFFRQRDDEGRKIFWSRGNGWVIAGIVHMLEALPAGHPSRARYETLLQQMASKLITLQGDNGAWPTSLLSGERQPAPETSGTGFFVYALAWGVNHGILDETTYREAIDRGWSSLTHAVQADGKLGWVQRIGDAPGHVTADDTQFYGVGAFLLAGSQIIELRARPAPDATSLSVGWEYLENNTIDPARAGTAASWVSVDLPHTWNAFDSVDTTPGYRRDASWYRKSITLAPRTLSLRHALFFEAANMKADVYVNGTRAGGHVGGYLPFEIDISESLHAGTNTVLVRVDNSVDREVIPSQSSDFVLFGGLTRDVFLVTRPRLHIAHLTIDTPAVSADAAQTRISATLANFETETTATLRAVLRDARGAEVSRAERPVALPPGRTEVSLDLPTLAHPALWSPASPALYTVEAVLMRSDGTTVHSASDRIGYRWFDLEPHGAFRLNGERLLLRGSHRHEEHAGYGGAVPNAIHRADLLAAKTMGVNFLRLGHYPQDPAVYRAADELGILIWDELPWCRGGVGDAAWKENTERMLREQIAANRNHPSIIFWSLGNELDWLPDFEGGGDKAAIRSYFAHLQDVAKALDPSRLTAQRRYYDGADISDVFSPTLWPGWYSSGYSDFEPMLRKALADYPHMLHMEYGGDSHVGRHLNRVHDGSAPPAGSPSIANDSAWDETYIVDLFDWYLHITERLENFPGNAQWALKDFATPIRPDNPLPYINQKGLLDREGRPKEAYWVFKSYWTQPADGAAFCHIYGHTWTHRYGEANAPHAIRVYCNTPRARLVHNGVDLGTRTRDISVFPASGLVWNVPLAAGKNTLEATGYLADGSPAANDELDVDYRVGGHGALSDMELKAIPRDDGLVLIEAVALDAQGRRVLDSAERVHFSAGVAGTLLSAYGVPDKSAVIEMANGRATILYRPEPGRTGLVSVISQNFRGRSIDVKSR